MGKAKKLKPKKQTLQPYTKTSPKPNVQTAQRKAIKSTKSRSTPPPIVPFLPTDRILLVGEGDFSFSRSLLTEHGCSSLIATSYDKQSVVTTKYPQARTHVQALEAEDDCKVLYGVDAVKLGKSGVTDGGGKEVKKGNFDKVVFNFPHVGGLTRDVNRQVRYNQELLVGFFKAAIPLLANEGSLLVTIFEGEPYDLWNIRDLARHSGLKVERSFKFSASAYPGYKHARTLGNIEGGGGWKGEDRPARTYIFNVHDGRAAATPKRKDENSYEDSDED
ncbi:hypothetical protein ACLMJK_009649 [Lecanora helva]